MLYILIHIALVALGTYALFRIYYRRKIELADKFPGPPALPVVGNALSYAGTTPEDDMVMHSNWARQYGSVYRIWVGPQLAIFVTDPKAVETVLGSAKLIDKSSLYDFLVPWLGRGLLLSTGKKWFTRRRIITPTFHFKILEQFVEIFDQQSNVLIKKLKNDFKPNTAFDIYPLITLFALDVVCETAMGTKINAQTDIDSEYTRAVKEISRIVATRFIVFWQRNDFLFNTFAVTAKKEQEDNLKILHDFTNSVIHKRRDKLISMQGNTEEEVDEFGVKRKMALLDVLLQATTDGQPLSDDDIREEVDTFMFEGHDTTTSAICFALSLISRHPEVQAKLFSEIKAVFGNDLDYQCTIRDLNELKYLDLVVKETLRLYPSVPVIARRFNEETEIGDKIAPAGSNCVIAFFDIFRNPDIYPNPEKFDPDRFSNAKNTEISNPFAYTPFSAGSRNCIGQKFAQYEIKSTVSKILRHFELLPLGDDPKPVIELVLRSKNGINLGLKPRVY